MPSYDQGYQTGAKQGTRFLGEGPAYSDLAVDLSQYATDFTDEGAYILEAVSARLDVAAPRTIHAELDVSDSSEGLVFYLGNASGSGPTALEVQAGGLLVATEDGSAVGSLALTVAGTARAYHVAWVTERNPDATGPTDAAVSWLLAYDDANTTPLRAGPFAHALRETDDSSPASWGADPVGDGAYADDLTRVSFHDRAWTLAEVVDTWVSSTAAPTVEATIEREALPLTLDSGIGDRSERQGPPGAWAARSLHQLRRRLATGRSILLDPATITSSHHTGNPLVRLAVGSSSYRWSLAWLFAMPVVPTVSHLWVRLHVDLWVESGAAVPTGLRVYSVNRPPVLALPDGAEPYDQVWIGDVVTRDDGEPGLGAWTLEGLLPIRRGTEGLRRGWAYVMLAYAFDPEAASGNDANARLRINAIQLAPCYPEPEAGGPVEGGQPD